MEILSILKGQQNKPDAEYERPKTHQKHYSDETIYDYAPQIPSTPTHSVNSPALPEVRLVEPFSPQASPAKRSSNNAFDVPFDEVKDQPQIQKRKKYTPIQTKKVPQVCYVSMPDNTTKTFKLSRNEFLANIIRKLQHQTQSEGFLSINGINCKPRQRPQAGLTLPGVLVLKEAHED